MRTVIINRNDGEDLEDVIARFEQKHPRFKRKTLEQLFGDGRAREMRREAAIMARIDRRKFGDDY